MDNGKADGEVFNIGTGEATTIDGLAKTVLELTGSNVVVSHEKERLGDIKHSSSDVSKAEKLLGYKPKVCLRDGLVPLLSEDPGVSR